MSFNGNWIPSNAHFLSPVAQVHRQYLHHQQEQVRLFKKKEKKILYSFNHKTLIASGNSCALRERDMWGRRNAKAEWQQIPGVNVLLETHYCFSFFSVVNTCHSLVLVVPLYKGRKWRGKWPHPWPWLSVIKETSFNRGKKNESGCRRSFPAGP